MKRIFMAIFAAAATAAAPAWAEPPDRANAHDHQTDGIHDGNGRIGNNGWGRGGRGSAGDDPAGATSARRPGGDGGDPSRWPVMNRPGDGNDGRGNDAGRFDRSNPGRSGGATGEACGPGGGRRPNGPPPTAQRPDRVGPPNGDRPMGPPPGFQGRQGGPDRRGGGCGGRSHDDNGHGNDIGGFDPSNPGRSTGAPGRGAGRPNGHSAAGRGGGRGRG